MLFWDIEENGLTWWLLTENTGEWSLHVFLLVLITVGWLPVMNILRHGQLDERFILLFSSTGHWEFSIQCGLFSEHGFTECQKGERLQMFQPPDLLEMSDGKTNNVIFFFQYGHRGQRWLFCPIIHCQGTNCVFHTAAKTTHRTTLHWYRVLI